MANSRTQPDSPGEPDLPAALLAVLKASHDARVDVPADVDAAILRDAREGFWRGRRVRLIVRWVGATAAAAAAVVLVAVGVHRTHYPTPVTASAAAGDVDGSGRVDMLDALILARKLDAAAAPPAKAEDVNGDGAVDRRDVDAVAALAVRLPGGVQ